MAAEIDDDEKYLYGENGESKDGVAEIKDKKLDPEAEAFVSVANETSKKDGSSQGNNADENDDEDSYEDDDDDDDDDVQVTIDEVNTAGAYGASFGAGVNWAAKGTAAPIKPTTGVAGDAKRLDIEAVGQVNDVSIYEYDIDLGTDEKPWRKPGADITDFFNYGFTEDTWKQYCERQRRLRMEVSGQKKQFVPGTGMIPTVAGLSADPNALKPKTEGTIDVIVESRRRTGVEEPVMAFPPPDMNFVRGGFPRPFHKTFPAGPMQVPPPGMFPRHPNMPPGMRPPFMPPPMGAGFQIPVAPQSEAPTSISNPPASGAPTSSSAGTIQGSAADGTGNVMAPPHAMMPPMGAQAGHLFAPDGTPLDGMAAGIQMPPGMPGSEMFARGPMDPFLQASGQMNSVFGAPWDMSAFHEQFTRSPERSDESDSENRRHRRRDKDRHREHRDRDKDRDRDRDRDRERRHRDRDRDRDRRDRDRDRDKDKERSRTRDKERSSRRSERSKESKSDRKKPRSTSRQREDSEETETPRKKSRRSRPTEDSYQEEKEEGEASEE